MSKSMVDQYEQALAADPSSSVFVELARAYLEQGDNERAIAVCQQGLTHHPDSVAGRVLWGKALIGVGRAAEAMRQFDAATSIDRDNPYAYNLIGEALLRKGLYRSALPVLRRAAALQPDDGRLVQWLEQTKIAMAGGPPPVLGEGFATLESSPPRPPRPPPEALSTTSAPTPPDPLAPSSKAGDSRPPPPSEPRWAAPPSFSSSAVASDRVPQPWSSVPATLPDANGFPFGPPPEPGPRRKQVAADIFAVALPGERDEPTQLLEAYQPGLQVTTTSPKPRAVPSPADFPFEPAPSPPGEAGFDLRVTVELPLPPGPVNEVTSTSESELPVVVGRAALETLPPPPGPGEVPPGHEAGDEVFGGLTVDFERLRQGAPAGPRAGAAPASAPRRPGLLEDLVSEEVSMPEAVAPRSAERPKASGGGLLDDIPEVPPEAPAPPEAPTELNPQAAEAIAREYEQELKAKLEATKKTKTFLQRHGLKLALAVGVVVVGSALAGSFWLTRQRNQGETLASALAKGLAALAADTKEQYGAALRAFEQAESMDSGNSTALVGAAYAHAMLYAEHGQAPADRQAARAGMTAALRSAFPEYALVIDFLTAADGAQADAERTLLDSPVDKALVHAHAGRVLLGAKRFDDALQRLKRAIELDPRQTLALVALGDYYLAFEDWDSALEMMSRAEALSRLNPQRVLGHAEARLELGRELPEALAALEGLQGKASLAQRQEGRYALLLGWALSANGRHEEAEKALSDGLAAWGKTMGYAFDVALAQAQRAAGRMPRAQKYFEDALRLRPKSEEAKEGLGRALLAQGRERELLDRLRAEKDQPRVALVRGIAWFRLADLPRAREELARTQVGGKYPSEAALYLALADAAEEGTSDRAVEILEKAAQARTRQRSVALLALARVRLERKQPDQARAALEEAAKDPADYEAGTELGRLLLESDVPVALAVEPLERAFKRNASYAPARQHLVRALLAAGRFADAAAHAESWLAESPSLELARREAARASLEAGRVPEAQAAAAKLPEASEDVEGWRIRARVAFAAGDATAGMAALQRANKIDAHDAATFCEIGHALVRQGDAESAAKAYAKTLEEDPRSACGKAGLLHARPTARGRPSPSQTLTGLVGRARSAWDRAFLQATLARVHLEERELQAAASQAEAAVAAAPAHPVAWFALGEVARRQRDEERAREAFTKVTALDQAWGTPHLLLADLLAKAGDEALPRALQEYELVTRLSQNDAELTRANGGIARLKKQLQK